MTVDERQGSTDAAEYSCRLYQAAPGWLTFCLRGRAGAVASAEQLAAFLLQLLAPFYRFHNGAAQPKVVLLEHRFERVAERFAGQCHAYPAESVGRLF